MSEVRAGRGGGRSDADAQDRRGGQLPGVAVRVEDELAVGVGEREQGRDVDDGGRFDGSAHGLDLAARVGGLRRYRLAEKPGRLHDGEVRLERRERVLQIRGRLQAGELRELRNRLRVVHRVKRVLVLQLRGEQLEERVFPELRAQLRRRRRRRLVLGDQLADRKSAGG